MSFSDSSTLCLYTTDPSYKQLKSYSKADCRLFRDCAALEASRLRQLIDASPYSNSEMISFLAKKGIIVGIEDLVSGNEQHVQHERRAHSKLVCKVQKKLKKSNGHDPIVQPLALIASSRSSNSVNRAQAKAAMAA